MSFGGPPDESHQDVKISAAIKFAETAIRNPHEISDADFQVLRSLFTVKELSALSTYVAFISGANKLSILFGLSEKDLS